VTTLPDPLFTAAQHALAGQYSLERELGRGGMGVVFLAREVELDRLIALKVLPSAQASQPDVRERFLREARLAASLSHPHIVPIHRVGEAGDIVFFSMAFVDGETLGERLRSRGPLAPSAATRLLREVAQALAYSHSRGIIHRDVKPDNILIDRASGRAMVSDFGIAGAPQGGARDEPVMGTPHFMSPEQRSGAQVDARSDIYSLGVVAFLSLSGLLPQGSQSLADASPATPPQLVRAIDRCLAIDPAARHANAEDFAGALDAGAVARVELPPPLREWLDAKDPWTLPYIGWSLTMVGVSMFDFFFLGERGGNYWIPGMIALIPAIPATLYQLRSARRVFDAGFTVDDLRAALDVWRAERSAAPDVRAPWWHPFTRAFAWFPVAALVSRSFNGTIIERLVPRWATFYYLVAAAVALPSISALGIPLFPKMFTAPEKSLARRIWGSPLGRWLERELMRGRTRGVASSAFRPTERVLGSAVEDLVRALPAAFREQLGDVNGVVERLQRHAETAREALMHLDGVTAVARDARLSATREQARRQLTESVSALEAIRLDLLRLISGDADLRPMTTVLDAARRVDEDLARLKAAQSDAERVVRPLGLDLRPHTPV
jgi:serine/threonine-protein kinase